MPHGKVVALCICAEVGEPMTEVNEVIAETGNGLVGDRYYGGNGSWNKGSPGKRQVTLMNAIFFEGTVFKYTDSRRNIFTEGVELMDLIGKEFTIGEVTLRGVKYCDPCNRLNQKAGIPESFRDAFFDRGGLVAEIVVSGTICVGDTVKTPRKDY
jgi:hypothetical protein